IEALRMLNSVGYGTDPGLELDLVYNPGGAFLPPPQQTLERDYKRELGERYGVAFNRLLALANLPINRFAHFLERSGQLESYHRTLSDAFNPDTVPALMCRHLVSADWLGNVYDCDFNQMLDLPAPDRAGRRKLWEFSREEFDGRPVATGAHCFRCAAGAGSSCGGSLARLGGVPAASTYRRQDRLLQCRDTHPRQNETAVGACLQAIASACTPPGRESPARPAPTVPRPTPRGETKPRCRSLPAGDCIDMHGAGKNRRQARSEGAPPRPRNEPKPRCRSLPAGDCIDMHAVRKNRRQGRLLQCPTQPPRRNETAVGGKPAGDCIGVHGAGKNRRQAGSYSAPPRPRSETKPRCRRQACGPLHDPADRQSEDRGTGRAPQGRPHPPRKKRSPGEGV